MHLDGGGKRSDPLPVPPAVARLTALRDQMWAAAPERVDAPLHGIGIGSEPATGTARVVFDADELSRLEDGDILVTVTTTTAFNAVFPLLAGVVTQHGGLFSHTALLAASSTSRRSSASATCSTRCRTATSWKSTRWPAPSASLREGHCCTRAIVNNVAAARPDSVRTWLAAVHSRRKRFQYAGVSLPFAARASSASLRGTLYANVTSIVPVR